MADSPYISIIGPDTAAAWAKNPPLPNDPDYQTYLSWRQSQQQSPSPDTSPYSFVAPKGKSAATFAPGSSGTNAPAQTLQPLDESDLTPIPGPPMKPQAAAPSNDGSLDEKDLLPVVDPKAPKTAETYRPLVVDAIKKQGLPDSMVPVIMATIQAKSNFDPNAQGPKDPNTDRPAQGLMHLDQETIDKQKVTNPTDPAQNIDAGVAKAAELYQQFHGNVPMVLAADRFGATNPSQWSTPEARAYVANVYKNMDKEIPLSYGALQDRLRDDSYGAIADMANESTESLAVLGKAGLLAALTPNDTYHQELDLLRAQQAEYNAHVGWAQKIGTGLVGFAGPGMLLGKGIRAGAKIAEAGPDALQGVAKGLRWLSGGGEAPPPPAPGELPQIVPKIVQGASNVGRGAATGAIQNLAGANVDPVESVPTQVGEGAGVGALLSAGASAIGPWAAPIAKGLYNYLNEGGQGGWIKQAQQHIGTMVPKGTVPATSSIVDRTLPEQLKGENPRVNSEFKRVAKGKEEALLRATQNKQKMLERFHQIVGTGKLRDAIQQRLDALGRQWDTITGGPDLDISDEFKLVEHLLKNSPNSKVQDFVDRMNKVRNAMLRPKQSGPAPTGMPIQMQGRGAPAFNNAQELQDLGKSTGVEHMRIYDPNLDESPSAYNARGDSKSVRLSPKANVDAQDPDHSLVLQHNHPTSHSTDPTWYGPLSTPDFAVASNKGISWIVAHGHDNSFSAVRLGDKIRSGQAFTVTDSMKDFMKDWIKQFNMSPRDSWLVAHDLANTMAAEQLEGRYLSSFPIPANVLSEFKTLVDQKLGVLPDGTSRFDRLASRVSPDEGLGRVLADSRSVARAKLNQRVAAAQNPGGTPLSQKDLAAQQVLQPTAHEIAHGWIEPTAAPPTGGGPRPAKLESSYEKIFQVWKAVKAQLEGTDGNAMPSTGDTRNALLQVKEALQEKLNTWKPFEKYNEDYNNLKGQLDAYDYLHKSSMTNATDTELSTTKIKNLITKLEAAPFKKGVLGDENRAKRVTDFKIKQLKELYDELVIADKAKPKGDETIAPQKSALSYIVGQAATAALSGASAVAGYKLAQEAGINATAGGIGAGAFTKGLFSAGSHIAQTNKQKLDDAILHAMLYPQKYPPLPTAPTKTGPGFYAGAIGAPAVTSYVYPSRSSK